MRIFNIGVFVFCILTFYGCKAKNCSESSARPSLEWVKDAVVYEVYLRSFSKEGTFKALEDQILRLKKIGVTVISLMPIHPIGELNRKGVLGNPYAVKDFYTINPEYGTLDDFRSLVNAVHLQNMKLIINLAAGHAAWDSQLLVEHPDWFVRNAEGGIVSPSSDCDDVAQIDYNKHEPRKYMTAMMKYWVKEIDIDGFQCSTSEAVPIDFWNIVRVELDKIKPVIMVSEEAFPERYLIAFDLTFSWNVLDVINLIDNGTSFASIIDDSLKAESRLFPKGSLHLRSSVKNDKYIEDGSALRLVTLRIAKAAAALSFTLPGVPMIFNGEETGSNGPVDLFNKEEIDWIYNSDFQEYYGHLSALRRDHPAIQNGEYVNMSNTETAHVFSFLRSYEKDSVIIVINFAKEKKTVNVHVAADFSKKWNDLSSNVSYQVKDTSLNFKLAQSEILILTPISE